MHYTPRAVATIAALTTLATLTGFGCGTARNPTAPQVAVVTATKITPPSTTATPTTTAVPTTTTAPPTTTPTTTVPVRAQLEDPTADLDGFNESQLLAVLRESFPTWTDAELIGQKLPVVAQACADVEVLALTMFMDGAADVAKFYVAACPDQARLAIAVGESWLADA